MLRKKIILLVIISLLMPNLLLAMPTIEDGDLDSYVLIDRPSGHILLEKKKDDPVHIEGATNILTAIIAIEESDLSRRVTIGENPVRVMGTKVYLQERERIVLSELVRAALVYSANDAALAIAENHSGTDVKFVEVLNAKASELGCENTVFTNSFGQRDSRHVTTAYDLAIMAQYAMNNETFAEFAGTKSFNWSGASWQALITNRNILVEQYPGIKGVMAGTRGNQDRIDLVLSYQDQDRDYLLVMTNANVEKVFDQATQILQYTAENYEMVRVVEAEAPVINFTAQDGTPFKGLSERAISIPIRRGTEYEITKEFFMQEIKRPVRENQKIGEVLFLIDGEQLERMSVISDTSLSRRYGFFTLFIYAFAFLYAVQIAYRVIKMRRKPRRR